MFDRKLAAALAALIILTGCAGRPGEAPAQTQEQSSAADTGIIAQGTFPSQEEGAGDGAENAFPEGSGYSAGKGYVQASTVGTEEASAVLMEKTRQLCGLDEKDSSSDELFNALFDLMEVIDAVRVEGDYTAVLAKVKGADTEKASGLLDEIYGDGYRDGNIFPPMYGDPVAGKLAGMTILEWHSAAAPLTGSRLVSADVYLAEDEDGQSFIAMFMD